jgi:hypothetical protein
MPEVRRNGKGGIRAGHELLELLSSRSLTWQQECFGKFAFAAKLERAEILVPRSLRNIWFQADPDSQLVKVFQADVAVVHPVDEMVADGGGKPGPGFDLRHGSPEIIRQRRSGPTHYLTA